jgi:hypothetical protein
VAGPWFTVQRSGGDWQVLDNIWISNGKHNDRGQVELRVEFEELNDETTRAG